MDSQTMGAFTHHWILCYCDAVAIFCTWNALCIQSNPSYFHMGIFPQVAQSMACLINESQHNTMLFSGMARGTLGAFSFKPEQRKSFLHASCRQSLCERALFTVRWVGAEFSPSFKVPMLSSSVLSFSLLTGFKRKTTYPWGG